MIEVLPDLPDGVVGVDAVGKVGADVVSVAAARVSGFSSGATCAPNGTKVFPTAELEAATAWAAG